MNKRTTQKKPRKQGGLNKSKNRGSNRRCTIKRGKRSIRNSNGDDYKTPDVYLEITPKSKDDLVTVSIFRKNQRGGEKEDVADSALSRDDDLSTVEINEELLKHDQLYTKMLEKYGDTYFEMSELETDPEEKVYGHDELFQHDFILDTPIDEEKERVSFKMKYQWGIFRSSLMDMESITPYHLENYTDKEENILVNGDMTVKEFLTRLYFSMRQTLFYITLNNPHIDAFNIAELNGDGITYETTMKELQERYSIRELNVMIQILSITR